MRSEGQAEIANRFAGRRPDLPDPFAGLEVVAAPSGAPVFAGAMGYLDCLLTDRLAGGDHSIFVGRVEHAEAFEPGLRSPLLFYDGGFRRVAAG